MKIRPNRSRIWFAIGMVACIAIQVACIIWFFPNPVVILNAASAAYSAWVIYDMYKPR